MTDRLMDWEAGDNPLRAGVSSFGIGGTNVHLIVEEPPKQEVKHSPETWRILPISAKTPTALKKATDNLLRYLEESSSDANSRISDIAYTLQVGRQEFQHRCIVTCKSREDAIQTIKAREPGKFSLSSTTASSRPVVFMFPGQGSQYVNMAKELYLREPIFKKEMDTCFNFLLEQQNLDIKSVIFPEGGDLQNTKADINESLYTQPILFSFEYALAKLWMAFGVQPLSMIGHSIGEYTAACISGVFSLEDALLLVGERGRLIQALPHGDMLSVRMPEKEIRPFLNDRLSIAAVNTPNRCVISGDSEAIGYLKAQLEELKKDCGILHTSHAFHSHMLDSILEPFREVISKLAFNAPQIPYISNVTGDWIRKDQAIDPDYWVSHLRGTVQFSKGITRLLQNPTVVLLEVGPGRVLRTLSAQNLEKAKAHVVVSSVCPPTSKHSDLEYILSSLGRLWLHGVNIDWEKLSEQNRFRRIPLPTYPFERRRHWLEAKARPRPSSEKIPNIGDWFYLPTWKQAYHKDRFNEKLELTYAMKWLIFVNQQGLGAEMAETLRSYDQKVIEVAIGDAFKQINDETFVINPKKRSDFEQLIEVLSEKGFIPQKIVHMWTVIGAEYWGLEYFYYLQTVGITSIIYLLQVMEEKKIKQLTQIQIVTDNAQEILGNEQLSPGKSPLMAL
ncbi:type I polyketide synthase, partial [bacterium]|nr:type I polyketide synthase [bacterium]